MDIDTFVKELKTINILLDENQLSQLDEYYHLLVSYNEKVNLTSITKREDVYLKHFYDSLTLIKACDLTKNISICDIGTGAGFPGIVLKIVFPNLTITLLDSLEKRIKFLNEIIEKLKLQNIRAFHTRIEDYNAIENFDIVVTRAVAHTSIILELGCQLAKKDGLFILMKGKITDELENSKSAICKLNYQLNNLISFKLPIENSERNILVFKKINATNNKYPRKFSEIKKKSL